MPSRNWKLRIQDILDSIDAIRQGTQNITFEDFANNRTIIKSILYDFIIIGEAARNVPPEIQSRYPDIPWSLMIGMRNVSTHEYFQVTLERIWATIQEDLLILVPQLQELLEIEGISST
jgi:uncharacterized protein with HEPN domain